MFIMFCFKNCVKYLQSDALVPEIYCKRGMLKK